jgi:hypothetical protein
MRSLVSSLRLNSHFSLVVHIGAQKFPPLASIEIVRLLEIYILEIIYMFQLFLIIITAVRNITLDLLTYFLLLALVEMLSVSCCRNGISGHVDRAGNGFRRVSFLAAVGLH